MEYFISKGLKGSSTNGSDSAMTLAELRSRVEESYPTSQKREKQKPQLNVVSSIIRYAARYQEYLNNPDTQLARIQDYGRYEYVYNDFTYLTGLKMIDIITGDYFSGASFVEKAIQDAMERRLQKSARRIELDSVMKVVRANMFGKFLVDMIKQNFKVMDYRRAMDLSQEYFINKFNILPNNIKKVFLHITNKADKSIEETDKEIMKDLSAVSVESGLLNVEIEDITNEKLRTEAIASDEIMKELDAKFGELLDSMSYNNNDNKENS